MDAQVPCENPIDDDSIIVTIDPESPAPLYPEEDYSAIESFLKESETDPNSSSRCAGGDHDPKSDPISAGPHVCATSEGVREFVYIDDDGSDDPNPGQDPSVYWDPRLKEPVFVPTSDRSLIDAGIIDDRGYGIRGFLPSVGVIPVRGDRLGFYEIRGGLEPVPYGTEHPILGNYGVFIRSDMGPQDGRDVTFGSAIDLEMTCGWNWEMARPQCLSADGSYSHAILTRVVNAAAERVYMFCHFMNDARFNEILRLLTQTQIHREWSVTNRFGDFTVEYYVIVDAGLPFAARLSSVPIVQSHFASRSRDEHRPISIGAGAVQEWFNFFVSKLRPTEPALKLHLNLDVKYFE